LADPNLFSGHLSRFPRLVALPWLAKKTHTHTHTHNHPAGFQIAFSLCRSAAALRARLASHRAHARAPRARTFTLLRTRAPQHRSHARAPRACTLAPRRHSTRAALESSRSRSCFVLRCLVTLLPHRLHESTTPRDGQGGTPPRVDLSPRPAVVDLRCFFLLLVLPSREQCVS